MYKVIEDLIPKDKRSLKCPYAMAPTCIVVHNTGNDASAAKEIAYMKRNDLETSYHFAVDDIEVRQGIPLNRNAFHAGDGAKGKGNREGISIEVCYSKSGGDRFRVAEENAAEFIAGLLLERGWGIDRVTKHQDYSGKYCPERTLNLGWDRFLKKVQGYIDMKAAKTSLGPTAEDCTNELLWRGIINNRLLWNERAAEDEDVRWLLIKYYPYMMKNGGSVKNPLSVDTDHQAIEILNRQGIISDVDKWTKKAFVDKNIYWLLVKLADYIN